MYMARVIDSHTESIISPHGIAMPKGLYFTVMVSSSFLLLFFFRFRCLIWEVTERILTKLGHIFRYDCYSKNLVRTPQGIYPPPTGWVQNDFKL